MTFLTGAFLTGLAFTGVPVIIHFIIRRRRKLIPWGAMQFLAGSPPRFRQRLLKLNELLVLLLRILGIVAVVLAFAQPLMLSGIMARRAGDHVFIVDTSLSTTRILTGGQSAFSQTISAAEKALADLRAEDTVRILVASDAPRWLTAAPLEASPGNRDALRSMLRELRPTEGGSDMPLAIAEALQARSPSDRNARRIVLFTDATERPWHAADVTRWRAIKRSVADAPVPTVIEVAATPWQIASSFTNLTINRLTVDHDTVAVGDAILVTAEIRNTGTLPSTATEVIWQLDSAEIGRTPLPTLGDGVSTTVEFAMPVGEIGSHVARASLAAVDELPADSAAVATIRTLDQIPILIVDGGRRPNSNEFPGSGFLLAALGQLPGAPESTKARAAFQPKIIDSSALAGMSLDPYFCVLLVDVEEVELPAAKQLATYVAKGGGLWMALGERTNTVRFNEVFPSSTIGLSPVQLGQITGKASETEAGWRVLAPKEPHPATAAVADTKQLDIDKARVQRHHTLVPPIPGNLGVLLKLESQAPFVIEHVFGKGRVFLQLAPLDRTWTNLPILQLYVPLVREFLWRLVEGRVSRRNLSPGETLRLAVDTGTEPRFEVKLPDGQTSSGAVDEKQIRFSDTFLPGLYRVERLNQAAELFSVPRPAAESDLTPLSDRTQHFVSEHGPVFGDAASKASAEIVAARHQKSIAPVLLASALAFFILEAILTLLFARQRKVRHAAVNLTPVTMR
jgi:hypothetical protein